MKKIFGGKFEITKRLSYCVMIVIAILIFNTVDTNAQTIYMNSSGTISSYEGKIIKLTPTAKQSQVKWSSSDTRVAVVNQQGVVRLKNAGKVWIRAAFQGNVVKKKIIVKKPYIICEKTELDVGEQMPCMLIGAKAIRWKSSDPECTSIDDRGMVTAYKTGNVIISAYNKAKRVYSTEIKVYNSQSQQGLLNNKRLISHRGYNVSAPENTMSAFQKSYEYGYKYVETDVTFTADGVPVLLHDDTVDRTSNGTGKINSLTFEEVRTLDFGSWKSKEYLGERIPSFDEFMDFCSTHDIHPYVELKSNITQDRVYTLMNIVDKYQMRDNTSWVSFNVNYLQYMRNANSTAELGLNVISVNENTYKVLEKLKTPENRVFLSAVMSCYDADVLQRCNEQNIPIGVWICDTRDEIFTLDPYVSVVTTNGVLLDQ